MKPVNQLEQRQTESRTEHDSHRLLIRAIYAVITAQEIAEEYVDKAMDLLLTFFARRERP